MRSESVKLLLSCAPLRRSAARFQCLCKCVSGKQVISDVGLADIHFVTHAAKLALKSRQIGLRSGLIGVVIQLGRDLQLACDESSELAAALTSHAAWQQLTQENGPLSKLLLEQQGTFAGGKPNSMSMHGMYEDDSLGSQVHMRALLGIREYSQMHQSLNLGVSLRH